MRRHELRRVKHSQDGGISLCAGILAFDSSIKVGWREVLSWYPMEQARQLDTSMATFQQSPWITRGTRGPDYCWDPGGISHHIIESVGDGSCCAMGLMFRRTHIFRSLSEPRTSLVTGWFDKRVHPFQELYQHIDHAWSHRVISLLWQELVGGGGIDRPPYREVRRDGALLWEYGTLDLWRIGEVMSLSLACEESGQWAKFIMGFYLDGLFLFLK